MPDFLVTVNITFECDEGSMCYSKTFIPQVKLIGHKDLADFYQSLDYYSKKCAVGQAVGSLANNRAINVYDRHSDMFLARTLKMLLRTM